MKVKRPYAYCCAEGGGRVETCDCVNKNHGTALFDVPDTQPTPESDYVLGGEAAQLVYRIEASGALEYESENFQRWKETARELAPRLRAARPTPADDAERRAIPEGMVPWHGEYGPPRDVDHQKPVQRRNGRLSPTPITGNQWLHVASHADADIIAYTPKPRTTEAQLREIIYPAVFDNLEGGVDDVCNAVIAALEAERGS